MDDIPTPTTIAEVENLVLALYAPNTPEHIKRVDSALRRLQESSKGWEFADQLLERADIQLRFFGALTLVIKLNQLGSQHAPEGLEDNDAGELLKRLVGHWIHIVREKGNNKLVVDKLATALVTFFYRFPHLWHLPLRHLFCSLIEGAWVTKQHVEAFFTSRLASRRVDEQCFSDYLNFINAFIVEGNRNGGLAENEKAVLLKENWTEVRDYTDMGLNQEFDGTAFAVSTSTRSAALACYRSATIFHAKAANTMESWEGKVWPANLHAIQCIVDPDLGLEACDTFIEILENCAPELAPMHAVFIELFESKWAETQYARLKQGMQDELTFKYVALLIAFSESRSLKLIYCREQEGRKLLLHLRELLAIPGIPGHDDEVYLPLLLFWSNLAEEFIDYETQALADGDMELSERDGLAYARSLLVQGAADLLRRLRLPNPVYWDSVDDDDKAEFKEARAEYRDFIATFYTLKGDELISALEHNLAAAIEARDLLELELAYWALAAVYFNLGESADEDAHLDRIVQTLMPTVLTPANGFLDALSGQALRTILDFVQNISWYIDRHHSAMAPIMQLLFTVVCTRSMPPNVAMSAAQTIKTLCSSARKSLSHQAGVFVAQYQQVRERDLEPSVEGKIAAGVASILQAMPPAPERDRLFKNLVQPICDDWWRCLKAPNPLRSNSVIGDQGQMAEWLSRRLQALDPEIRKDLANEDQQRAAIAEGQAEIMLNIMKGWQTLDDTIIDLAEGTSTTTAAHGAMVQPMQFVAKNISMLFSHFIKWSGVTRRLCSIFRASFAEKDPGPFAFSPKMLFDLFVQVPQANPAIGTMIATMSTLVRSIGVGNDARANEIRATLPLALQWTGTLTHKGPDLDPEVAQNSIEFLTALLQKCPEALLLDRAQNDLLSELSLTLRCVASKEPLVRAAATEFWSAMLALRCPNEETKSAWQSVTVHCGPELAQRLILEIGGLAARSDLDKLAEPLRKLVVHSPNAKTWLNTALHREDFPSGKVTAEEKKRFLNKLMGLRGQRTSNAVIKEFWVQCRGSDFAYTS